MVDGMEASHVHVLECVKDPHKVWADDVPCNLQEANGEGIWAGSFV
jgi:hypothetical protein